MSALVWAAWGVDWGTVARSLESVSLAWVVVACLSVAGVALAKVARWQALYGAAPTRATFGALFSALMTAQMINLLIPVRVGELLRLALMKQSGQSGAYTLSTVVTEKAIDLTTAGLLVIALLWLTTAPPWLQESAGGLLAVSLILSVGLSLIWAGRRPLERWLIRLAQPLPAVWRTRLLAMTRSLLQAWSLLTDWRMLRPVLGWNLLVWLVSLVTMLALFQAYGFELPLSAAVLLMLAVSMSNIAPSPPALVGLMPGLAVLVLQPYQVPQAEALSFGLVLNGVTVGPLLLLGGVCLWGRTVAVMALFFGSRQQ